MSELSPRQRALKKAFTEAHGYRSPIWDSALRFGATREEIMEVLQLISVLGIPSMTDGVPLLVEEMAAGRSAELPHPGTGGEREARLEAEFTAARGHRGELWDDVVALSPDFVEAYMRFSSVPQKHGVLVPKLKEFIYIATEAATTHPYAPGTRAHIRNAIGPGATRQEIMEVLEFTSVLGIQGATHGVPILLDELVTAGKG